MSVEVQALAPMGGLVKDFLTELSEALKKFEIMKPSAFHFVAVRAWKSERDQKIAEIVSEYVKSEQVEALDLVPQKVSDQLIGQLIKETCMVEKERQRIEEEQERKVEFVYYKIFKIIKEPTYLKIFFIIKKEDDSFTFLPGLIFYFHDITIFIDRSGDELPLFKGMRTQGNSEWLTKVEFHVYSEDDVKSLFNLFL